MPSHSFKKKIGIEFAAILGLSLMLGVVFNSANPLGIRWSPGPQRTTELSHAPSSAHEPVRIVSNPSATPLPISGGAITAESKTFAPIIWEQVKPLLTAGRVVLVDARPRKTHGLYNIPGSVSLPFDSSPEELSHFFNQYGKDSHLVIYCAHETCLASQTLAEKLAPLGYRKLHIMKEGYFGWLRKEKGQDRIDYSQKQKEAIQKSSEANNAAADALQTSSENSEETRGGETPAALTWAKAKPLVESGSAILVDVRGPGHYEAGHIPGAVNLPESLLDIQISEFVKKYPVEVPLILYCSKASCSVSKRVAEKLILQHGYRTVYYMSGGYEEWQKAELVGATAKN